MESQVKEKRKNIIRSFCRTILWIDDEIPLCDGEKVSLSKLFKEKMSEFESHGLLCHLKGFPQTHADGGSDFYVEEGAIEDAVRTCVKLALQADVVIIDWKLGDVDSSCHAQNIIKELLGSDKGFRFIVVLSKDDPEDSKFKEMDESFKSISDDGCLLKTDYGQFLLSLRKDEFKDEDLFERICIALLSVYPDYLHLSALEISGRIKDVVPQWLASITSKADIGILVERGNTMKDNERWLDDLQECITSNLMEDLGAEVLSSELSSLGDDVLKLSNNPTWQPPETCSNVNTNIWNNLKKCVGDTEPEKLSKDSYKALFAGRTQQDLKQIVEGIEAFTEFCERRSGVPVDMRPIPGAIYEGMIEGASDIAVCITGGCDCLRSKTLMFLVGKELSGEWFKQKKDPAYRGGKTILRFKGKVYIFCGQASSVFSKNREEVCTKEPVGVFRRDILDRLVSRYMSHIRRVAVNQPAMSRKLRGEEGDEA